MDDMPTETTTESADETVDETVGDVGSPVLSPEIEDIIARDRALRPGFKAGLSLSVTTGILLWMSFAPLDWGPIAWIALVPLLQLIRIQNPSGWMYRNTYLAGLLYWLVTLQWMRLGDPSMYLALCALAVYLAAYWPLFVWLCRIAVHRLGVPVPVAVPVFWIGLEYLRSHLVTGFAWYLLGHTQYRWVEIIQISDLWGAYAVSFLVALANASVAQLVPVGWFAKMGLVERSELDWLNEQATPHRKAWAVAVSLVLVLAAIGYGFFRRSEAAFLIGPRVGLVQGNFVASIKSDRDQWGEIFAVHRSLTGMTVPHQPDLIVWPEAMFRYPMLEFQSGMSDEELDAVHPYIRAEDWRNTQTQEIVTEMAQETNAALCIGINIFEARPNNYSNFNSALFVTPQKGIVDKYHKIHRVPFGEFIPLKDSLPFIQSLTPFRGDFGIDAGDAVHVFRHKDWNYLPLICFEDTVPHLVRRMVSVSGVDESAVDVLVNVTNDGWFHGSSELNQHLITASFRCIETRTPMVRAVNTGISAIIDGDGVVRDPEIFIDGDAAFAQSTPRESIRDPRTGRYHKQLNCALVGDVPLDQRTSLYVWWGDWAAALCLIACAAIGLQGLRREHPRPHEPTVVA